MVQKLTFNSLATSLVGIPAVSISRGGRVARVVKALD